MPDDDDSDWAWYDAERLHRAAAEGNLQEMARLVDAGHALHAYDDVMCAPLHHAAEAGQCEAAEWLLARGADVNAHQEERIGETPLSLAVQNTHPEMVELLLRHGADPDIPGWMCLTARDRALQRQRPAGLRMQALIAHYAPVVKPRY
jgi:ankyrin repeat protein